MYRCGDNGDCRSGYVCANLALPGNAWGASLADRNRTDGRVCVVPASGQVDPNAHVGYCQWTPQDASLPDAYVHIDTNADDDASVSDAQ